MKETNALLAGEMSGHTFFKDRYYGFDDAVYAGCRIIEIVAKNKAKNPEFKVEDLLTPFEKVHSSLEVRLECENQYKKPALSAFEKQVKENITVKKESEMENKYIDELLETAAKNVEVNIPQVMIDEEVDRMSSQYKQNLSMQGLTSEQLYQLTNANEEALKEQRKKEAEQIGRADV